MQERIDDNYSLKELFTSLNSYLKYLRKQWLRLVLFVIAGALLGVLYFNLQKPVYKAVGSFILEEKSSSGGLAGLASQFGFNIGSLGNSSMFSGDNILNILKSKKVVEHVLLVPVDSSNADKKTLADLFLDFTHLRKKWVDKPQLASITFTNIKGQLTPLQDSVLNVIYETVEKKYLNTDRISKQGTIIRVEVAAANSLFARAMTENLIQEASRMYLEIRVGNALANIYQLQRRSDSLLWLLNNKSYAVAASQQLDINPGLRTAVVPTEIGTRDKTVLATLYAEVTKNLEASKLLLSQQTPVIQVLDRPDELLKDDRLSLPVLIVLFVFAFSLVYIISSFLYYRLFVLKHP